MGGKDSRLKIVMVIVYLSLLGMGVCICVCRVSSWTGTKRNCLTDASVEEKGLSLSEKNFAKPSVFSESTFFRS